MSEAEFDTLVRSDKIDYIDCEWVIEHDAWFRVMELERHPQQKMFFTSHKQKISRAIMTSGYSRTEAAEDAYAIGRDRKGFVISAQHRWKHHYRPSRHRRTAILAYTAPLPATRHHYQLHGTTTGLHGTATCLHNTTIYTAPLPAYTAPLLALVHGTTTSYTAPLPAYTAPLLAFTAPLSTRHQYRPIRHQYRPTQ
jgi:hypothetical protein